MTNLELCQELREECGVSGDGTPVSVSAQTGELKRIVGYIARSYEEVQNENLGLWDFLREDFTFVTIAGTAQYTLAAIDLEDHKTWKLDTITCYTTATGVVDEQDLIFVPWDAFRAQFLFGATRDVTGRPVYLTVRPDKSLEVWPKPDAAYTIGGEHWKAAQRLEDANGNPADAAAPAFPEQFHRVLIGKGMMYYGAYEGAPEVYARGESLYNKKFSELDADQGPDVGTEGAIA